MRPGSVSRTALSGIALAAGAAPALVLSLAITAAIASAAAAPAAASLHASLDRLPGAASLVGSRDASFWVHLGLARPALAGTGPFDDGASPAGPLRQEGALGGLLVLALANAAVASVLSGGFAARFAAGKDRGGLPAFASDAMRFAPASLLLGALSVGLLLGFFHLLVTLPGRMFAEAAPRYEWEAVLPRVAGGALFLVAGAFVRSAILAARGAMGLSGSANPIAALGTGLGLVVRRPASVLVLEAIFFVAAFLPTVLWVAFSPALPGWQGRALDLLGQQVALFLAVASRAAHLGALQSLTSAASAARSASLAVRAPV